MGQDFLDRQYQPFIAVFIVSYEIMNTICYRKQNNYFDGDEMEFEIS